jgi:hypothetical protein
VLRIINRLRDRAANPADLFGSVFTVDIRWPRAKTSFDLARRQENTMPMIVRPLWVIIFYVLSGLAVQASEVIQVDVRPILTGRAVTTLTDGKLVPWTKGIDGGGRADGYMTLEASVVNGDKNAKALPNDGCFTATKTHPFVRLNFTNADDKRPQMRSVEGEGGFLFPVPGKKYQRMMVFMTSAEGPSHLRFKNWHIRMAHWSSARCCYRTTTTTCSSGTPMSFRWPRIWPSGTPPVE